MPAPGTTFLGGSMGVRTQGLAKAKDRRSERKFRVVMWTCCCLALLWGLAVVYATHSKPDYVTVPVAVWQQQPVYRWTDRYFVRRGI